MLRSEELDKLPATLVALGATEMKYGDDLVAETFRTLYFLAAGDVDQYKHIFPHSDVSALPSSVEDSIATKWEKHRVYFNAEKLSHRHTGRNCGNKFRPGEPIYRCLDCGFDATCVLCVNCFNADDHAGHRVVSNICSDMNSGICDCGDPEAWTQELHCKSESSIEDTMDFDVELSSRLKKIYSACLDYIIQVLSHLDQTLPSVKSFLKESLLSDPIQDSISLILAGLERSASSFGESFDEDHQEYSLVFWNDEFHNFNQARDAITAATGESYEQAIWLANKIDRDGRVSLKMSKSIGQLMHGFKDAIRTNFTASILTKKELRRQSLITMLIDWMLNSIDHPNSLFQSSARRAFCESVCSEFEIPFEKSPYWNTKSKMISPYKGLLYGGSLPDIDGLTSPLKNSTRLQYLLFFDVRLWKRIRRKLHSLLISSLVSDLEYKRIGSGQIVRIYPLLLKNFTHLDREPHLNAMDEIATQFFTCPTNSTDIVTKYLLGVIKPIEETIDEDFMKLSNGIRVFTFPSAHADISTSKRSSVKRALGDLDYILDKSTILEPVYSNKDVFAHLCRLIEKFDRCWQIKRKEGEHVHTESYEYVSYLNMGLKIIKIISDVTVSSKLSDVHELILKRSIKKLISYIVRNYPVQYKKFKNLNLIDFKVSKQLNSFLNPSLAFLGKLLSFYASSSSCLRNATEDCDFLAVADVSLRSIVLEAQINCQFWVRNGTGPASQALTYREHLATREGIYFMDVYLSQVSFIVGQPGRALLNVLDRFELLNWFNHEIELDDTVYEEKIFNIVEKLISFLYALLTFRDSFIKTGSNEEELETKYRTAVIYNLFAEPKPYSDIENLVDGTEDFDSALFESVLNQVSDFNPPKGLNDDGYYSLKPELLESVDPLQIHTQGQDFHKSLVSLTKSLAKGNKKPEDIIVHPQLIKVEPFQDLGQFTRTLEFAKLIAKLLDYALSKEEESFTPMVLHLLHAAIVDDEQVYGSSHIHESILQVPICENLFNIAVQSNFAKSTKNKADYLLSSLIVKDSDNILESLSSCFGEQQVNDYKEKKKDAGFYFDETESEKKRRLAKERQKKIMSRMQRKQKVFLDKNQSSTRSDESDNEADQLESDIDRCVLCQGPETSRDFMCAPLSITKSNVFKNISKDAFFFQRAFLEWSEDGIDNSLHAEGLSQLNEPSSLRVLETSSSCNHLLHFKCLRNYLNEGEYHFHDVVCPLCKTKHDTYIPALGKTTDINRAKIDTDGDLKSRTIFTKFSRIIHDSGFQSSMGFLLHSNREVLLPHIRESSDMGTILSNSIKQAEIATRINGNESYTEFLNQIPEQTYKTLRLLLQYYGYLSKEVFINDRNKKRIFRPTNQEDFVTCFILFYFNRRNGFWKTARKGLSLFFKNYVYVLLSQFSEVDKGLKNEQPRALTEDELLTYRSSVSKLLKQPKAINDRCSRFFNDDDFTSEAVAMVKRIMLPDLRGLAILYKLLVPEFDLNLPDFQGATITLDDMLKAMGLKNLYEILKTPNEFNFKAEKNSHDYLPYPGVIKLVDLPLELSYFTASAPSSSDDSFAALRFPASQNSHQSLQNRIDYAICLSCGSKFISRIQDMDSSSHLKNMNCCKVGGGIYFFPSSNEIKILSVKDAYMLSKNINAPYLNSHGQSGYRSIQNGHVARLNHGRYKHLNSLWLSGGINPFLSRQAVPIRIRQVNNTNRRGLGGGDAESAQALLAQMFGETAGTELNTLGTLFDDAMRGNQLEIPLMDFMRGAMSQDEDEDEYGDDEDDEDDEDEGDEGDEGDEDEGDEDYDDAEEFDTGLDFDDDVYFYDEDHDE